MTETTEVLLAQPANHAGVLVALDAIGMEATIQLAALYYQKLVQQPCPCLVYMFLGCCGIYSSYRTTSFPGWHALNFLLLCHWIWMLPMACILTVKANISMKSSLSRPLTLDTPVIFIILIDNESVLTRWMFHYNSVANKEKSVTLFWSEWYELCLYYNNQFVF